jgi:hypothetical protein
MDEMKRERLVPLGIAGFLALACLVFTGAHAGWRGQAGVAASEMRRPVLVELFTSEGCSSCPPADELLQKIDRTQPVMDAEIVVLSEHVDYWDDDHWRDPFSSHAYSERQDAYASRFGLNTVYTPQMVVDGRFETVGSDERRALGAVENAAKYGKATLSVRPTILAGQGAVQVHVDSAPLPASADSNSADVTIALADESDESHVRGGENGGRTLTHVSVLRSLTRAGSVDKTNGFAGDVTVPLGRPIKNGFRVVVIVQAPGGRVWGVTSAKVQAP